MLSWLTDRLILRPSRHEIPCDVEQRWIDWDGGRFEVRVQHTRVDEPRLLVLKFPGTAGRAERSTSHPADCWQDLSTEVWTVNPPGYGASPGRASLRHRQAVTSAAWHAVRAAAADRPVVVTGNSLGAISAMYLAGHYPVDGLVVRNPVPLRNVIVTRFGPMASLIARKIPPSLCPIDNAAKAEAPAVFVSSRKDRTVPVKLQQLVYDGYAGESQLLAMADADHADLPSEEESQRYVELLEWLRERVLG